jgi:hypothetical protein
MAKSDSPDMASEVRVSAQVSIGKWDHGHDDGCTDGDVMVDKTSRDHGRRPRLT